MTGKAERLAGSPTAGEPAFLAVGRIRKPHGVKGEVLVELYTDFPQRLVAGTQLHLGPDHRVTTLRSSRPHGDGMLLAFEGIHTPETAGLLRNLLLFVPSHDRPGLPDGEYYHHELMGMRVVTDDGRPLGVLTEIMQTGANDVYVITTQEGKQCLLPAIPDVILGIDLAQAEMRVHLLPGLLEEEQ